MITVRANTAEFRRTLGGLLTQTRRPRTLLQSAARSENVSVPKTCQSRPLENFGLTLTPQVMSLPIIES